MAANMWFTVLGLALAVNFEPMRLGLITVALSRPRPVLQLLAFLSGSFLMSATAGLIVLFVVRPGLVGATEFHTAKVQIAFGLLAMLAAAVLASNITISGFGGFGRRASADASVGSATSVDTPGATRMMFARARGLAQGSSPWFSGAMGLGIALPSIDYLALLVLIATSGAAPLTQASLLFTFIAVANTVVAIPMVSFLVAPAKTRAVLEAMRVWVQTRTRRDVALILAIAGCVLIVMGVTGL